MYTTIQRTGRAKVETYLFPYEVADVQYINGTAFVRCPKIPSFERWLGKRGRKNNGVWMLKIPVEDVYEAVRVHVGDIPCTYVTITFPEETTFPANEIVFGERSVLWVEGDSGEIKTHIYAQSDGFYTLNGKLKASAGAVIVVHYIPLGLENDSIAKFKIEYPYSLVEDTGLLKSKI